MLLLFESGATDRACHSLKREVAEKGDEVCGAKEPGRVVDATREWEGVDGFLLAREGDGGVPQAESCDDRRYVIVVLGAQG